MSMSKNMDTKTKTNSKHNDSSARINDKGRNSNNRSEL